MKSARPMLTDDLLKDALANRANSGSVSGEILDEVLLVVGSTPQSRGWAVQLPRPRRPFLLVVVGALLVSALVGSALIAGAYRAARTTPLTRRGDGGILFTQARYAWDGSRDSHGGPAPTVEDPRLFSVQASGGEPSLLAPVPLIGGRQLIGTGTDGPMARWSPDGSQIAFRLLFDEPGIYVMNRDGSQLRRITDLSEPYAPGWWDTAFAWSPDGSQIAFAYPAHAAGAGWTQSSSIYLVDVSNGRLTTLVGENANGSAIAPIAWSPDGTKLAFGRVAGLLRHTRNSLSVIDVDGSNEVRLVELPAIDLGPLAWSADGSQIEFLRDFDGSIGGGLWAVNADGTSLHIVARGPWALSTELSSVYDWGAAWSPDRRWIAQAGDGGIRLLATDGSFVRTIDVRGLGVDHLSWSPDGSELAFMDSGGEATTSPPTWDPPSIYVVATDGTDLRWVADGEYPDWSR